VRNERHTPTINNTNQNIEYGASRFYRSSLFSPVKRQNHSHDDPEKATSELLIIMQAGAVAHLNILIMDIYIALRV
jgi:hypothetical protein